MSKPRTERFGHPPGLYYLAFTEAWERFSFYGMQALLVLYMVDSLLVSDPEAHVLGFRQFRAGLEALTGPLSTQAFASQLFGLYAGLVYLTPIAGGMIGDRLLGPRRTVVLGAALMACGHVMLALDRYFLVALLALIVGSGCLKGNISTQVGALYPLTDSRRDRAYLIFNVGINVGAFFGPVLCGALGETYGWHWGFAAAGIGMMIGLAIYLTGYRHMPDQRRAASAAPARLGPGDRRRIAGIAVILLLATCYNIAFGQSANVFPLWLREVTDRQLLGFQIPIGWYLASDGLMVVTLTPLVLRLWKRQAARQAEPDPVTKIAIGCGCVAAADVLLAVLSHVSPGPGSLNFGWGFVYFLICDFGYLFMWPVTLAVVSRAAPPSLNATIMGVAFLSLFAANLTVGWLGRFYETMSHSGFWLMHAAIAGSGLIAGLVVRRQVVRLLGVVDRDESAGAVAGIREGA